MATLLSGALTSCNENKFLDLKDPNHFTEENFWRNKADAESGLAAAYSPIKYQMYGYYGAFDGWLNLNSRGMKNLLCGPSQHFKTQLLPDMIRMERFMLVSNVPIL